MKTLIASLLAVAMVFTLNGCSLYAGGSMHHHRAHHHGVHHNTMHHRVNHDGKVVHKGTKKVVVTKKVGDDGKVVKEAK